jgi:chaperonin GroEL
MKEKKARVEDALHATRAAVEEGIIPGGEIGLLNSIPALDKIKSEGDELIGVNIIKRALEEPLRQLVGNAGVEGSVIVAQLKKEKNTVGFDAEKNKISDMFEAGIIDPTKVARTALMNAASIASLLITTEAVVADKPEKENKTPAMPQGMPGGMGGGMDY